MADRPDIAGDLIYVFDHAPLPFLAELAREMEIPISFDNLIVSEQEIDNMLQEAKAFVDRSHGHISPCKGIRERHTKVKSRPPCWPSGYSERANGLLHKAAWVRTSLVTFYYLLFLAHS